MEDNLANIVTSTISATEILEGFCKPIQHRLGVNYIIYKRVFSNASHTFFTNCCPNYIKDYFELVNKCIAGKFLFEAVSKCNKKLYFEFWPDDKSYDCVMKLNNEYSIFDGLTLCINKGGYVDTFSFAFSRKMNCKYNLLINNLDVIKDYVAYFYSEGYDITDHEKHPEIVIRPRLSKSISISSVDVEAETNDALPGYGLIINSDVVGNIKLTKKETLIALEMVNNGITCSKLIALKFNISPRTVDIHCDNLREKLNCCSRNILVTKLKEFIL